MASGQRKVREESEVHLQGTEKIWLFERKFATKTLAQKIKKYKKGDTMD
jgi:hypothetical protein